MVLSTITLRSNLVSAPLQQGRQPGPREQQRPETASSIRDRPVVVNEQMGEMMTTGCVPKEMLDPEGQRTPNPHDRPVEDIELAKWKAVEVFKVKKS